MYKYFISWRYICKRLITLLSIIGVAFGVMVLVVVLSVMDGFKTEFISRLQGTLSHLIVNVRSAEQTYPQLEKKILELENVKACAPHLNGLVLIGTGRYYAGGMVVGIDYEKEIQVGKLKQYLVTPYKEQKLWAENFLEKNIRERVARISWTVVACEEFKEENGETTIDVLCKEVREHKIKNPERYVPSSTRYVIFSLNSDKKIFYINKAISPKIVGSFPATPDENKLDWQQYFQGKADKINSRDLDAYMTFFDKNLSYSTGGIDPDDPFAYEQKSNGGELAEVDPEPIRPLLVGYELMRQLGMRRGDEIALLTGQRDLEEDNKLKAVSRKFIVVGSFKSGWQEIDARMVYAKRDDLNGFLEGNSEVSEICISIEDYEKNSDRIKDILQQTLNPKPFIMDYVVQKWEDRRRTLLSAIRLERNVMAFILFFIVVLAVATIMIILILLVAEKTKDIGILKSMGASDKGIMSIFIYNGFFISCVGSVLGGTAGIIISLKVNWIADRIFELTGFRVFPRDVYYLDKIPTEVNFVNIAWIVSATLVLAFLACKIPALQAARMNVVDALRSESPSIKLWVSPFAFFGMMEFSRIPSFGDRDTKDNFFGVRNLHRKYMMGERPLPVLSGVDLQVKKGEIVSILGKSGQGKSTLLNQMGLLDTPDSGTVFLQGYELNDFNLAQQAKIRGKKIGFIFQFYHLLPEFTALENVMLSAMILHSPASWIANKKEAIEYAKELLTMVGLEERMEHYPLQLSGGERQRVAIARALMNKPDIILCDEPTGNLDNETSRSIQDILWRLNREMEQTFVIVTHDEELAKSGHRVFRMESGQILEVEKESL